MKISVPIVFIVFMFLLVPVSYSDSWDMQQIQKSHRLLSELGKHVTGQHDLVMLSNNKKGKIWLIDNNNLTVLDSIQLSKPHIIRILLSSDKHNIFFLQANGKVEIYNRHLKSVVSEIKVGRQSSSMAISHDGRYLAIGNLQPHSVVILDATNLTPLKYLSVHDGFGMESGVAQIYPNPIRETFAIGLNDIPQLWEISYADNPYPGFSGWEHGYHNESGDLVKAQPFPVRRLIAREIIKDFRFGPEFLSLIGNNGEGLAHIVDVDIRRTLFKIEGIKELNIPEAAIWDEQSQPILASSQQKQNLLQIIDTENWQLIKSINLPSIGQFVRAHPQSPYAFVSLQDQNKIAVIDKAKLEFVRSLNMQSDDSIKELKFGRHGKHLYVQSNHAIEIVDSQTLKRVKRFQLR